MVQARCRRKDPEGPRSDYIIVMYKTRTDAMPLIFNVDELSVEIGNYSMHTFLHLGN